MRARTKYQVKLLSIFTATLFGLVLFSFPTQAHHSFAAEFNVDDRLEFTGVITNIQWVNPHIYMTFETKTKDGGIEQWKLESFPPLWFHKIGMSRHNFPVGETMTISGWRAKDRSNLVWIKAVRFSDGHEVAITGDNPQKETQQ